MSERACTTCILCLRADYGYSNWTPMGAEYSCLAGLNPALDGLEEEYGDMTPALAAALDVAKTCPKYREGAPATLDVDLEGIPYDRVKNPITVETIKTAGYTDDDEAAAFLVVRFSPEPE